ncbi:MAG: histidine phosphatase family protein [Anaerolineae bacterium]|nr:histidine phosphatase family protein [Anaerolineae bacterium]
MAVQIVFETHSLSEDNERGLATGWHPGRLSPAGRQLAAELGQRRAADNIAAVFASDLHRAVETETIAFGQTEIPILLDWRLRECDYGQLNSTPSAQLHQNKSRYLDEAYPGGESWRQAVARVGRFLPDLALRWQGVRVLVIGHVATRWALDHYLHGQPLEDLLRQDFAWREGWEYQLGEIG